MTCQVAGLKHNHDNTVMVIQHVQEKIRSNTVYVLSMEFEF